MNNNNYIRLAKRAVFLAGWFLIAGCGEDSGKKTADVPVKPEKNIPNKPPSSYDDTLVVAPPGRRDLFPGLPAAGKDQGAHGTRHL